MASVINLELAQSDIRLRFQRSERSLIFPHGNNSKYLINISKS
ncbi:hypothetical protein FB99_44670 (plasmid) [Pantoea agglomerans]|nr:hypothetical protein FB99_44670 [Pantoea agglomerans]